jgi:RNA polymerase sigma-70 factor, ECF subfamily
MVSPSKVLLNGRTRVRVLHSFVNQVRFTLNERDPNKRRASIFALDYKGVIRARNLPRDKDFFLPFIAMKSCDNVRQQRVRPASKRGSAMPSARDVTQLLIAWSDGDQSALEKLTPLVHAELHRLARRYMAQEGQGHTLQATALVNEAYLRLIDWKNVKWQNRAHFFGVSANLMRRVLVDYARSRSYQKRGGGAHKVQLEEAAVVSEERAADFVALDDALNSLSEVDPRKSRIVELRFFGGLGVKETAEVLGVSPRTVMREWSLAQAWLYREISRRQKDENEP